MMKKTLTLLILLCLALIPSLTLSANGLPYRTFTYSQANDRFVYTQDAYLPLSVSYDLAGMTLNEPEDITIDRNDNVYIADRGNSRVIKYSLDDNDVTIIGEGVLNEPTGIHVGIDQAVYIADFANKEGYKFVLEDDDYVLRTTYQKPIGTPYFTENDPFEPTKIVTDQGNNVYLLLAGNINGMAEYENSGQFFGFFGGNRIPSTWDNILKYILFDETQRRNWFQMIPKPVHNVAVDRDGLILTTTKGDMGYLKLNIANFVYSSSVWGYDDIEDLFVGPFNTIFTANRDGYITEYGPDGSVLFVFSGPDQNKQKGLFASPSGIAVDSKSNIYVIDKQTHALQVFIPTEFADLVHHAIALYQDGKYKESLQPWQEVLKMNSLFDLANKGIGDAYFAEEAYEQAMEYYLVARDSDGYSDAFWEVRNAYLLGSGGMLVTVLLSLFVLYVVNKFTHFMSYVIKPIDKLKARLRDYRLYRELVYPFYIFKHPGDGYYGIKRENKSSGLSATIYLFLFFLAYLLFIFQASFLFNPVVSTEINLFQQVMGIFLPFFLFVVANYLVCSIRDGEGRLKDVYHASAYTLLPMIIVLPLATIISNGLTYNEAFIFQTIMSIGIFVTVIYVIIMVKEIHFYDMKPTIWNLLITIFTGLMILAVVIIVYLLLNEVYTLVSDVIRELILRG
jgi:tetratricopeptide (TPR) repeat protein